MKESISKTVTLNGLKSVKEMADLTGYHRCSLYRIFETDREIFMAQLKEAKELKRLERA